MCCFVQRACCIGSSAGVTDRLNLGERCWGKGLRLKSIEKTAKSKVAS